ncbi:MAG: hypothetical protein JNG88_00760 [Phycisphaerales bacterium]|nr:hypothetical protein [Phycisphaerales bacterium]
MSRRSGRLGLRAVAACFAVMLICGCEGPGRKDGPTIDERKIDRAKTMKPLPAWVTQYLNAAGARNEVYFTGTLRCGNHNPAHTASKLDEMQMLADKHGCVNWGYLGIVSNDRITFENALRDDQ